MKKDIQISIVSHNQCNLVKNLIKDLSVLDDCARFQLTLTHNLPQIDSCDLDSYPFPIKMIHNSFPKGFAENHNAAFNNPQFADERRYYLVLNPDINITGDVINKLIERLKVDESIGVIAPSIVDLEGNIEDSARELPSLWRLFKKFFGYQGRWLRHETETFQPDWFAGMFMLFRTEVFDQIGGFDSQYFLYYEDVDICSRLWLSGYLVMVVSDLSVIHDARRYSRRNLKYMRWHIRSVLRFIRSDVYRKVKKLHEFRDIDSNI